MGHVRTQIALSNPRRPELQPVEVEAMVDTGAHTLCIPEHVALQLQLEDDKQTPREVTLADGSSQSVPCVGPIEAHFENRNCYVGALVMGDEVLLGEVPMEDMDLIVSPAHQRVVINPDFPNFPHALVK